MTYHVGAYLHNSRGPAVLAVCVSTLACATIFTALRLISRLAVVGRVGPDDYLVVIAWILAFATSFTLSFGTGFGLGSHEWDIPDENIVPMKKVAYIVSILYNPALMATKSSILLFYLHFSHGQRTFRNAVRITIGVVNAGGLALTLLNTFQCRPVSAAWRITPPETATCTNIVTLYLSSAPLNIITDIAVLLLPMPLLTAMHLPLQQKIVLLVIFGMGIFVAITDVIRIVFLQSAAVENLESIAAHGSGDTGPGGTPDFSWYAAFAYMWSVVEINVSIMCGSVPALKPLVSRYLPRLIQSASSLREKTTTTFRDTSRPPTVEGQEQTNQRTSDFAQAPNLEAPPPARLPSTEGESERAMDIVQFLTSQDPDGSAPSLAPPRRRRAPLFFDFVENSRRKNITLMNNRESIRPVCIVTVVFFILGFAYGLLATLNVRFMDVASTSLEQVYGEHSAYFVGYLVAPLTLGRLVSHHWGFNKCYPVGLGLYACGALVFWPAAVLLSFGAFLVSNFVVGMGLATLELAANPFIALCGPPEYAEVRLNLSQGVQAIGSIVAPTLAQRILFRLTPPNNLIDVQWTYLGIFFCTILLAVLYYYIPLEDATDEELEIASARLAIPRNAKVDSSRIKVLWVTVAVAVFAQFCYVGGQEGVITGFRRQWAYVLPSLKPDNYLPIARTAFAISRFLAAFLNMWIKPRYLLLFYFLGALAFAAACMKTTGSTNGAMLTITMFFEGPIFPLIYVQALRGMGKRTRDTAILLTTAGSGGALFPPIMHLTRLAIGMPYWYCIPVACFAAGTAFPLYLVFYRPAGRIVDPVRDDRLRREQMAERQKRKQRRSSRRKSKWLCFGHENSANANVSSTDSRHRSISDKSRSTGGESHTASDGESLGGLGFHTIPTWFNRRESHVQEPSTASTTRKEESEKTQSDAGEGTSASRVSVRYEEDQNFITSPVWLSPMLPPKDGNYSTPDWVTTPEWVSSKHSTQEEEAVDPTLGIGG